MFLRLDKVIILPFKMDFLISFPPQLLMQHQHFHSKGKSLNSYEVMVCSLKQLLSKHDVGVPSSRNKQFSDARRL